MKEHARIPSRLKVQPVQETEPEFHTGLFVLGLFLGPLALLSASNEKKGSFASAVKGWFCGWMLLAFCGTIFVFWSGAMKRNEIARIEAEKRAAIELQEKKEAAARAEAEAERQRAEALAEKERSLAELAQKLTTIKELKIEVNNILNGETFPNFNRTTIAALMPDASTTLETLEVSPIPPVSVGNSPEEILAATLKADAELSRLRKRKAELTQCRKQNEEDQERLRQAAKAEQARIAAEKDREARAALAKELIDDLDLRPSSYMMYHKYLEPKILSGKLFPPLKELREAQSQRDYLKFLNLARRLAASKYASIKPLTALPTTDEINNIINALLNTEFQIELTFKESDDAKNVRIVYLYTDDPELPLANVPCDYSYRIQVPTKIGNKKAYLIEDGAFEFLCRELLKAKRQHLDMAEFLETKLSKNVSYDEVAFKREGAERQRKWKEAEARREAIKREEIRLKREKYRLKGPNGR